MKSLKKLLEKESQKFPFLALSSSGTRRMTTQSLLCGGWFLELFVQFVCIITETFPRERNFFIFTPESGRIVDMERRLQKTSRHRSYKLSQPSFVSSFLSNFYVATLPLNNL